MITIANVVGSGDLDVELNLGEVGSDLDVPFTEYNPSNYHGLYVRVVEDGPLITIYRSGKYIISGCSSFEGLHNTNEEFLTKLSDMEITDSTLESGFTVQNVVCTAQLENIVNLDTLSIALGLESVEYEPEQFSGLIYRPADFEVVMLIFANGKVVLTGASDVAITENAYDHLQEQVKIFLDN